MILQLKHNLCICIINSFYLISKRYGSKKLPLLKQPKLKPESSANNVPNAKAPSLPTSKLYTPIQQQPYDMQKVTFPRDKYNTQKVTNQTNSAIFNTD